jgi:SAM-dependent methyltransferase
VGVLLNPPLASTDASTWVRRWSHLVPTGARVLDLACGGGRHARWFAGRGAQVLAVDRDAAALSLLQQVPGVRTLQADLEGAAWPLADGEHFDAIVVTNYLHRPLLPRIEAPLAEGGVLIYETFAEGQGAIGKPSNPAFLLRPGELLAAFSGLRIVAYEDGFDEPPPRFVQRIVAVRERASQDGPPRHRLGPQAGG